MNQSTLWCHFHNLQLDQVPIPLIHWGRVTHTCVSKLTIIASDNGWRQAIIWTNAGILLIGPLGTNFNEILIEIHIISFKKIHSKMASGKWRPSCLGLNVLMINEPIKTILRKMIYLNLIPNYKIRSHFFTFHNSSAAVACAKSRFYEMIIIHVSACLQNLDNYVLICLWNGSRFRILSLILLYSLRPSDAYMPW